MILKWPRFVRWHRVLGRQVEADQHRGEALLEVSREIQSPTQAPRADRKPPSMERHQALQPTDEDPTHDGRRERAKQRRHSSRPG